LLAVGAIITAGALMIFRENAPRIYAVILIVSLTVMLWLSDIRMKWKIIATGVIAAAALFFLTHHGYMNALLSYPGRLGMFDENETTALIERLGHVQIIGEAPEAAGVWMNSYYLASANVTVYVLVKFGILPALILLGAIGALVWRMIYVCSRIRDIQGRILAGGCAAFVTAAIAASFLLNALFIGTSGTYMPFLQDYGTDFVLYSVLLGLIAGLHRRKDICIANTAPQDNDSELAKVSTV
jgi:cell division protein FtsW (lipid II flippase)